MYLTTKKYIYIHTYIYINQTEKIDKKGVVLYTVSFIKNVFISLHWVKLHLAQVKYLWGHFMI